MKKSFLGLIAIAFFSLSSFTNVESKEMAQHDCTYRVYNASGMYLGTMTVSYPDFIGCSSIIGQHYAVQIWNNTH